MSEPLVTIITPCFNGEDFLDKYFDTILAQTYRNLQLIFVNDGSTDRTEEIALSYADALANRGIEFKYLYQPNGGQAKAMNTGFRHMTGTYLVWPDSDDLLEPDSIENRVRFFKENPQYVMVRSNADAFDYTTGKHLWNYAAKSDKVSKDIFLDLVLEKTYCCCGCYMIQVDAFREIYPNLTIMEHEQGQNWQILIPMAGRHPCGYLDEVQYHCAMRPNSHSRLKRTVEEEVLRRLGLREILEDGIRRSGRTDQDYEKLVELKYQRIIMQLYADAGMKKETEAYYNALLAAQAVEENDHLAYLKLMHPLRYRICMLNKNAKSLCKRIKRRLHLR